LSSCNTPEFENFSTENWKNDPQGCKGLRAKEIVHLEELKKAFYVAGETTVTNTLGRPNRHDLGKRMAKNYYYYVESECDQTSSSPLSWLEIKFNSVSQVEEIVFKMAD
jgi:hypothetical protein